MDYFYLIEGYTSKIIEFLFNLLSYLKFIDFI